MPVPRPIAVTLWIFLSFANAEHDGVSVLSNSSLGEGDSLPCTGNGTSECSTSLPTFLAPDDFLAGRVAFAVVMSTAILVYFLVGAAMAFNTVRSQVNAANKR